MLRLLGAVVVFAAGNDWLELSYFGGNPADRADNAFQ